MAVPFKDIQSVEAVKNNSIIDVIWHRRLWSEAVKVTLKSGGTYIIEDNDPKKFARAVIIKLQHNS